MLAKISEGVRFAHRRLGHYEGSNHAGSSACLCAGMCWRSATTCDENLARFQQALHEHADKP